MAFTWVTNAHGPSSQPTACRPPTCSLTSAVKSGVPPFPSCRPGFKSQAHHIRFYQFRLICVMWKSENKQKEAGIDPFLSKKRGWNSFQLTWPRFECPSGWPEGHSRRGTQSRNRLWWILPPGPLASCASSRSSPSVASSQSPFVQT